MTPYYARVGHFAEGGFAPISRTYWCLFQTERVLANGRLWGKYVTRFDTLPALMHYVEKYCAN